MTDQNDFQHQNISKNEVFIASAMNYLKYVDPEHAAREDAVSYLEFMQTVAKQVAKITPDDYDEYFKAYKVRQTEQ